MQTASELAHWRARWAAPLLAHLRTPLYRNGYALVANAVSTSVLGILYWMVAARLYATETVGVNSAVIATMTFLSSAGRLYLDGVLMRFLPRAGAQSPRLIQLAYLAGGLASGLLGLVFLLGASRWAPSLAFLWAKPGMAIGFVLATMASCIFTQQDGVLTGLRQAKWVPVENLLFAAAKLVLLLALARSFPEEGIFLSWSVPLFLSLPLVNLLIFRRLLPKHIAVGRSLQTEVKLREVVGYAGGLYAGFLFSAASSRLLPLVVLQIAGSRAAAYFNLPWMMMTSIQLIIPSMMGSLTVEVSRDESKLVQFSHKAFKQTGLLLAPAAVGLALGAPYVLHLFGQNYAAEAGWLLRLLSLATLPQIITGLYFGVSRVRRSVWGVAAVHSSLFVMNMALSYLLLGRLGVTGVGIAWLINQTLVALVLFFTQLRPLLWAPRAAVGPAQTMYSLPGGGSRDGDGSER
ncbi:MAG: lipopolysaccharide biosynthesis protein [Chloroflexota bacterium]